MERVLSEKGCVVGGVIWRYDDVEGQLCFCIFIIHGGGNNVSVAANLFLVFIAMSSLLEYPVN